MAYFLLDIGVLLGLYGLYRFVSSADPKQVVSLAVGAGLFVASVGLIFLAVTRRLPAALALLVVMYPFGRNYFRNKRREAAESRAGGEGTKKAASSFSEPVTRKEALEILGLSDGASGKEIRDAYTRLMKKVHPDQEGSKWMAAKLNEARDLLLEKREPDA